jgi:membrane protein
MIPAMDVRRFVRDLLAFPWRNTFAVLRERFREDQLGLTASSLTFTTTIALVPFFTVVLAIFTAFPMFSQLQTVLQKWLIESLIPDNIARQVLGYLTQFAAKSSRLGVAGLAVLLVTALALILTIDRTLNNIWRVRKPRRLGQRILIYWAGLTLGPLLLAASLTMTSYLLTVSTGLVGGAPGFLRVVFGGIEFMLLGAGAAALFHYVPHTRVQWAHAWSGGLFVAAGIELAKKLLSIYVSMVPSYSAVYGAFATVPIFLTWIYTTWVIVLLGAVIAAYLPSLLMGVPRRGGASGWRFQLALEMLQVLQRARLTPAKGLNLTQLAQALQFDALSIESVVEALEALDWIGQLGDESGRYVLLAEPRHTRLAPLIEQLLITQSGTPPAFWQSPHWPDTLLSDALADAAPASAG